MKQFKFYSIATILFVGMFFIFQSCQKDFENTNVNQTIDEKYQVSVSEAHEIASRLSSSNFKSSMQKSFKINEVPDENGNIVFNIINYYDGGFLILAADKRSEPIIAFSEISNFPLDTNAYPSGLVSFLYDTKEKIKSLREENKEPTEKVKFLWDELQKVKTNKYEEPIGDPDCTPYTYYKDPLINTKWGQGVGYNNYSPYLGCSNYSNGRAPSGCVATAMAQVMKYHQYPTNAFNWSDMPLNYGTNSTSLLMYYAGNSVDMDYSCSGSSASTADVDDALRNVFGYSSASFADYNYNTVKSNLSQNKPVILAGGRNDGWWIFNHYTDGHAWVCDGFINTIYPCYGSTLYFHMNWGWNGSYDGYYGLNDFSPGDYTFDYKRKMVYNINP